MDNNRLKFLSVLVVMAMISVAIIPTVQAEDNKKPVKQDVETKMDNLPMGKHYIKDEQGRGSVVYSTGPVSTPEQSKQQYEQDKENSWEMLKSIIIDTRDPQTDSTN